MVCPLYELRQKLYDPSAQTVTYEDMVPILACNEFCYLPVKNINF